jgi:hypothetical protein
VAPPTLDELLTFDTVDPNTLERSLHGVLIHIDPTKTIDEIGGSQLPIAVDGLVSYAFWPDYWPRLKKEFAVFMCTKDEKYVALRQKLSSTTGKSQTAIVSTISAAMAAQFGVVAGVLVPFVTMCLVVVARTGLEAFCSYAKWDTPLKGVKSRGAGG